jgi:hypothetical protein
MGAWRQLVGRLILVVVVFGSSHLGPRLGLLRAAVAQASHNFGDVPDSGHTQHPRAFIPDRSIARSHGGRTMPCGA